MSSPPEPEPPYMKICQKGTATTLMAAWFQRFGPKVPALTTAQTLVSVSKLSRSLYSPVVDQPP